LRTCVGGIGHWIPGRPGAHAPRRDTLTQC
jgi:hypothetical protein